MKDRKTKSMDNTQAPTHEMRWEDKGGKGRKVLDTLWGRLKQNREEKNCTSKI
jgi:hypothetical protein